jgi:hypothetical protein
MLLCYMFALGQRPTKDVRVRCLARGPYVVWVISCTAFSRELCHVMFFVGHPIANLATPLELAISKKRVDGVAMSYIVRGKRPLRVVILSLVNNVAHHLISGQCEVIVKCVNDALLCMAILADIGESTNHHECKDVRVNRGRPVP